MNKQSKKVEVGVVLHAALENNRAYLLRTEITKSHLNNRICQHCVVEILAEIYYIFSDSLRNRMLPQESFFYFTLHAFAPFSSTAAQFFTALYQVT